MKFGLLNILLFLLSSTTLLQAQPKSVGVPDLLIKIEGQVVQNPQWSPDGSKIAFSSMQYRGLWVANANGSSIRQITDKDAGLGYSWSSDSQTLLSRVSETVNRRRNHAIAIFDVSSSKETLLTEFRAEMPSVPRWAQFDEKVVLITDSAIESFTTGKTTPERLKTMPSAPFYVLKQEQIIKGMIPENSLNTISPFDDASYLNLSVSPDGRKLAFEVYGGNLYVMNVDGSGLIDLGRANRPSWSPDSKYVLANIIEDDGVNFTKADIYAFSTDGTESINLTNSTDKIALNPSWSPDGSKIAFDVPNEGAIYTISINQ